MPHNPDRPETTDAAARQPAQRKEMKERGRQLFLRTPTHPAAARPKAMERARGSDGLLLAAVWLAILLASGASGGGETPGSSAAGRWLAIILICG